MNWSSQQQDIFKFFENGTGHGIVRARAGTGKTTTILEAICSHNYAPRKTLLCAFNKSIQEEMGRKLDKRGVCYNNGRGSRLDVKTLHGLGRDFLRKNKPWNRIERKVNRFREFRIAENSVIPDMSVGNQPRHLAWKLVTEIVARLARKAKTISPLGTKDDLLQLALRFECLLDNKNEKELNLDENDIIEAALDVMKKSQTFDGTVSYDDMIYLPLALDYIRPTYDMVVVDEAQDINAGQMVLAMRACTDTGRIIVVGDDRQAIYEFRGADSDSLDHLKSELGAVEFKLTTTYRCPRSVVAKASLLVPDYRAATEAPEGHIYTLPLSRLAAEVEHGDFVLSRTNAPLVTTCMAILRKGKRAKVEGKKDIGADLIRLVERSKASSLGNFLDYLEGWEREQLEKAKAMARRLNDQNVLARQEIAIFDKVETLHVLARGMSGIKEFTNHINMLFSDSAGEGSKDRVVCSTVHKVKGRETPRVFILSETFYLGGRRRNKEEQNIHYVAITRSQSELFFVEKEKGSSEWLDRIREIR